MKRQSAVLWLIGINIVLWLISLPLIFSNQKIFTYLALNPSNFLSGKYVWTVITSMFMHDPTSIGHIFMNMFSLIFLGGFLERLIGSKRFLSVYFIAGIMGSLFFILFSLPGFNLIPGLGASPEAFAVGASGAIFGLAGMLAILTPRLPVYIMFIPIAMPMWFGVILILLVFTLLSAVAGLPIGNSAHLGGLLVGIIYALYLKNKYKRKAQIISNYYS